MKLNLGCGAEKKEGYTNVDWSPLTRPDVVHDLNDLPYPFENDSADEVYLSHVLEHLDKPFLVMQELHRILKTGGIAIIKVPHFSRGFPHPEHEHGFDITFPIFFNRASPSSAYLGFDFELVNLKMQWDAFIHYLPLMGYGKATIAVVKVCNAIFSFLANLSPGICSRFWCYWVGGFNEIQFVFKKV